tara:strand:- start:556 stop:876 length:321 start_codon:yes stop_codon:yes gene_type:complete
LALKRDPRSPEHIAVDALPKQGKTRSNHNVVFLPFSEALMSAPKDQKDRYLPCWQRPATKSLRTSSNYPTFANGQEPATPMLVPFDRSSMSLCVQRNGRWERIDQE